MIPSFRTNRSGQTVQTQIRLLLLIRVYTVCHSVSTVWTYYCTCMLKLHCLNNSAIFSGFCIFQITTVFEPSHEIMVLFVLHRLILQTHMHSHPVGLDVSFWVGPFVYFQTLCVKTAKALARLRGCAGSPEPSLVAYVISAIISWAGSFITHLDFLCRSLNCSVILL